MSDHTPQLAQLQIVTTMNTTEPAHAGYTSFCRDDYDCQCETCTAETARRVARGIRPRQPLPTRRAA